MRRGLLYFAFMAVLCVSANMSYSQVAVGGIAFTGYNSDDPNQFSFVLLQALPANTVINFTDAGWRGNVGCAGNDGFMPTNGTTETEIAWNSGPAALPYGRQVVITGLTASVGTVTGTALDLNEAGGDQIIAFTGSRASNTVLNIAAIHMNHDDGFTGPSNWDNYPPADFGFMTPSSSNLPCGLTNGVNALFIYIPNAGTPDTLEVDNAKLNSSVNLTNNAANDRAAINNINNWLKNDATRYSLPADLFFLPVDFTWIKASEKGGQVQVDFGVGTEEEIVEYVIERSGDGRLYSSVGSIPAARRTSYGFSDIKPISGTNFYRIKAVEISGKTKYSKIANINLSKAGKGIGVYPGIVRNNQFTLQITNLPAGSYRMNIHSGVGQLILSRTINHAGGSSTQTVNLPSSTQKGVYRVRLASDAESAVTSIVIE